MNIFITNECPVQSAIEHNDTHCRKMLMESCALLSTAHYVLPLLGIMVNEMRVFTKRGIIRNILQSWKFQYFIDGEWKYGEDNEVIYKELCKLNLETCSAEDVNKTIGNTSWTYLRCDECSEEVDELVELGEEPDYESRTANVCKSCLIRAIEALGE